MVTAMGNAAIHDGPFSLWLLPDATTELLLTSLIRTLAQKTGGLLFQPHITVVSGSAPITETMMGSLQKMNDELEAVHLQAKAVASGPTYFQSIFLTFRESRELQQLQRHCAETFDIARPFFPHLSLTYGEFSPERRETFCQSVALPDRPLGFDRLEFWAPDPAKGWKAIKSWRQLT